MTGRPATYPKEQIIEAIEKLQNDPQRDVNVNQIRKVLNGGNRDRIRQVLDEHLEKKTSLDEQAEAKASAAGFAQLEHELRADVGETLVASMNSVVSLIARTAESERAKARRELDAAREAYELLLRARDADVKKAKVCHAELCGLLDDVNSELDAAYASAARLTAQRDEMEQERDRLAGEANRLAQENARLAAELNKRNSRVRKPRAAVPVTAAEKPGTAKIAQPKKGPDRVVVERPAARGASDVGTRVLQSTMFSLTAEANGDGKKSAKVQSMPMDGGDTGLPDARNAQDRAAGDSEPKPSSPSRAGAAMLRAVGAVSPGPVAGHGTGGL